ncbi:MAG: DUF1624 domain-containing protein [Firmicutes bacterium]|nr:DUF1624 domain-containing protein [Bacillota bacterium]
MTEATTTSSKDAELPKIIKKKHSDRIWEIDFLRGLCILLVIMDHLFFNFTVFDNFARGLATNFNEVHSPFFDAMIDFAFIYRRHTIQTAVRFAVVFVFILVSGVSCAFSKNNGKRILKLLMGSLVITLMTIAVFLFNNITPSTPQQPGVPLSEYTNFIIISVVSIILLIGITYMLIKRICNNNLFFLASTLVVVGLLILVVFFGTRHPIAPLHNEGAILPGNNDIILFSILMIVALSVLVYLLAKRLWDNKWFFLGLGIVIMVLSFTFGGFSYIDRVPALREWSFLNVLESLAGTRMFGGDWYGILPWTGMFLIGAFFGRVLYADRKTCLPVLVGKWHVPISFCGRKTLLVYVIHQPAIILVMAIIALIAGYRFW